ncbi:MAG TPA: hypothetical protein VII45_09600, partial [Solirubrobacterales bacterium]
LAADPDVARVTLFEIASIGPAARRRFGDALDNLTSFLDEGREQSELDRRLPNLSGIAAGTIFARIYGEAILGRTAELPELLPILTYEVLLPFIGDRAARGEQNKAKMTLLHR